MHYILRDWSSGLVGALRFGVVLPPWDASWSLLIRVSAQSQLAWVGRNWGCAWERFDDRLAGHQFLVGRHVSRRSHENNSLIQYQTWSFADTRPVRGYLYAALNDKQSQLDHITGIRCGCGPHLAGCRSDSLLLVALHICSCGCHWMQQLGSLWMPLLTYI